MAQAAPNKSKSAQVRVIVCEDDYLRQEAVEAFRVQTSSPKRGDLNAEDFDFGRAGKDQDEVLEALLQAARTLPMMAKRRWVHGRGLDTLAAKAHPALLQHLAAAQPHCVLLLSAAKLDGRLKLSQALKSQGVVQEIAVPGPRELTSWVMQRARSDGLVLTAQGAAALARRIGPHFGQVVQALATLRSYAGPGPAASLDVDDVNALVAPSRDAHVFELTAALARRDWPAASTLLGELLVGGESPLLVLTMLARQLRLLLAAKRWRGGAYELADNAGVRPFVAQALLQEAKGVSEGQLMDALRGAQRCDLALKQGALPPRLALERLLWSAI